MYFFFYELKWTLVKLRKVNLFYNDKRCFQNALIFAYIFCCKITKFLYTLPVYMDFFLRRRFIFT